MALVVEQQLRGGVRASMVMGTDQSEHPSKARLRRAFSFVSIARITPS
jgi:hypothetical protein